MNVGKDNTGDESAGTGPAEVAADPVWARLNDQLSWYNRKGAGAQRWYKLVKLGQIVGGATVPVIASSSPSHGWVVVMGVISAAVVVAEGAQQLFQWHTNWVNYRGTAEALAHEKHLYLAKVGMYAPDDRRDVLAERVEALGTQENAKWNVARAGRGHTP